jgi:hypothetical protein
MLRIRTQALVEIADENGWLHTRGRLNGTINTRAMGEGLGVATSTVARAYDTGATGLSLVEKLHDLSGRSFDELLARADADEDADETSALAS